MKIKVDSDQNGKEEAVDMCQAVAEMMEDARAEGLDEGKKETQILVAEKLINRGGFTSEEISELSGLPEEEVEKIIKNA
jgi:predicted transposase/invertase (TIGR01784 family)